MGTEPNYSGEVRSPRQTAECEPDNDTRVIRLQVVGCIDSIREMRCTLDNVADRFWGGAPVAASTGVETGDGGDCLGGIQQALVEARAELAQLRRVVSRFERLA